MLLHGWPQTSYCWRRIAPRLAERHTVIAPDLRGFGDTDKPPEGYDKRTVATDIRQLLAELGVGRAVVVGHDIGAQVAFRLALDAPELLDGLVILNGRYPVLNAGFMYTARQAPERWYYFFNQIPDLPERMAAGNVEAYIGYILNHWSHPDFVFSDHDLAQYVAAFSKEGALTGGFNHYRAAREDASQWAEDRERTIDMPALVLWGRDDPVNAPEYSDGLHRVLTDMRFRFLDRCGHFPHEEQPEETASAILAFTSSIATTPQRHP